MPTEIQTKLQKIKKASIVFRVLCTGLMVVTSLLGLICIACMAIGIGGINYDSTSFQSFQAADLTPGHRILLIAMVALTWTVLFKCFYHLRRLFGNYSNGEIFTRDLVGQLRQFGIACLLWGVINFLWGVLWVSLLPHGPKSFHGHFDSFGFGAILIVISWFMDMAVDLREENELTI